MKQIAFEKLKIGQRFFLSKDDKSPYVKIRVNVPDADGEMWHEWHELALNENCLACKPNPNMIVYYIEGV